MYVDPNGVLAQALWNSLIGLLYIRTAGDNTDLTNLRALAAHWTALGKEVPMFAVDAEQIYPTETISKWRPDEKVDLLSWPYNLEEIA